MIDFLDFDINGKKRPYPLLWYQTSIFYNTIQFQVDRGVASHPLHEDVLPKKLRKTSVKTCGPDIISSHIFTE